MSIKRVDHGRGHSYIDTDTGETIRGVTTITSDGIPKQGLLKWAAESTANYAVDNWDDLSAKPPSVRLKELYGARFAVRDTAANRGTQVHKLAQRLVVGERVAIPDGLAGHVQSYVQFLDDFDVQPLLVEAVVVSHEHGYCGTLDLVADLLDHDDLDGGRSRWLLDVKTSRSGVFGETALQLAGYRYADTWLDGDGEERELPEVEHTGAVWVRADGYDLIPVVAEAAQHRDFLYAREVARFVDGARDLIGEPIVSHRASTFRLVSDQEAS